MQALKRMIGVVLVFWVFQVTAQERMDLEGASIRGEVEHPKVLHLVPWKTPDDQEIVIEPPQVALDHVLKPIDRSVFRSEIYYREQRRAGDLP